MVMMAIYSSAALKVIPTFQFFNNTAEFASLICSSDDNGLVSGDDLEWLYSNFSLLISTTDSRICGSSHKYLIHHLHIATAFMIILNLFYIWLCLYK